MPELSVRYLTKADIDPLVAYWLNASPEFLVGMGVDVQKMPSEAEWRQMLEEQLSQAVPDKKSYGMIWLLDGEPVGHSNINKIQFGKEAYMHLHLWRKDIRQKGIGPQFVRLCIPAFFENYQLQTLYCEPYALNPAPNKVMERLGFHFEKSYVTIPGWLNFEQDVNLWSLSREEFLRWV